MISVVVPAYQELKLDSFVEMIRKTSKLNDYEVIIVDASSSFTKVKGAKHIAGKKGRAVQMNQGANLAKGQILLFLHADTVLPKGWDTLIEAKIEQGYKGGAFLKRFDSDALLLRLTELINNLQVRFFHHFLGDNSIFVTKFIFEKMSGYKTIPIMEDVEFSKRLRNYRLAVIRKKVVTSARRFRKPWKGLVLNMKIRFLYLLGVSPHRLKRLYR